MSDTLPFSDRPLKPGENDLLGRGPFVRNLAKVLCDAPADRLPRFLGSARIDHPERRGFESNMRPLKLCRERLSRILDVLDREGGSATLRRLMRNFTICEWEVRQAADLGWLTIETRKPHTGRPSTVATLAADLSKKGAAKLPPFRDEIPRDISIHHRRFVHAYLGGTRPPCNARRSYLYAFPRVRSTAGADASASRLLRHPDVRAYMAWIRSTCDRDVPTEVKNAYPESAQEIRNLFLHHRCWFRLSKC